MASGNDSLLSPNGDSLSLHSPSARKEPIPKTPKAEPLVNFDEHWKSLTSRAPHLFTSRDKDMMLLGYAWGQMDGAKEIVSILESRVKEAK